MTEGEFKQTAVVPASLVCCELTAIAVAGADSEGLS